MTHLRHLALAVPFLALGVLPAAAPAATALSARPASSPPQLYRVPMAFEPNRGQTATGVRYLAHTSAGTAFLTEGSIVLSTATRAASPSPTARAGFVYTWGHTQSAAAIHRSVVRLVFDGANPHARFVPSGRLPGMANYFIGNGPQSWHTDIPTYAGVTERNVYARIDLSYGGASAGRQLEYTWRLLPGANPAAIRFHVEGAGARVASDGSLTIGSGGSRIIQSAPRIYQLSGAGEVHVSGGFRLLGRGEIGLRAGSYDRAKPLIVDPVLSYGTYLGGSDSEQGLAIAANAKGDAYVVGNTTSDDFPTDKALQAQNQGDTNIFVGKFNAAGTGMLFSTYIGGSASDEGLAIAVDSKGYPYITGDSLSDDYPTLHALQDQNNTTCTAGLGGRVPCPNVIITKLTPAGDKLVFSTYLGGNIDDEGYGIALDRSDNIYIAGVTYSTNFPAVHALQPHMQATMCSDGTGRLEACSDTFISKLNATGSKLIYSTYLGGKSNDEANGVAVDVRGDAYICGDTTSTDFPTANAAYPHRADARDAFAAALNPAGSALIYSTYLGGGSQDMCVNLAVRHRSAVLTGYTWSADFPTTVGAFDRTHRNLDAFVTRLTPSGSVEYSTLLGGSKDDEAMGIAIDTHDDVFVTGDTLSTDFPVLNAVQPRNAGETDAFVTELNPQGSGLIQSTYLGGTKLDYGHGIGLDPAGDTYVTGFTYSKNFPTVHEIRGPSGDDDAFVGRIGNRILVERRSRKR